MISSQTFDFLTDLTKNNQRDWFNNNKERYQNAHLNVINLVEKILPQLMVFDEQIPKNLDAKKTILRIYRDTRFSADKTPYKTNFGVGILSPGYYLHIEPQKSLIAGGYWNPTPAHLNAIRQEMDYNSVDSLKIVQHQEFVSSFHQLDYSSSLKRAPKGYDEDNAMIEYLKLKMFVVSCPISDTDLQADTALYSIVEKFKTIYPLNLFLRQAIS